jgi:hypothetical protein
MPSTTQHSNQAALCHTQFCWESHPSSLAPSFGDFPSLHSIGLTMFLLGLYFVPNLTVLLMFPSKTTIYLTPTDPVHEATQVSKVFT